MTCQNIYFAWNMMLYLIQVLVTRTKLQELMNYEDRKTIKAKMVDLI